MKMPEYNPIPLSKIPDDDITDPVDMIDDDEKDRKKESPNLHISEIIADYDQILRILTDLAPHYGSQNNKILCESNSVFEKTANQIRFLSQFGLIESMELNHHGSYGQITINISPTILAFYTENLDGIAKFFDAKDTKKLPKEIEQLRLIKRIFQVETPAHCSNCCPNNDDDDDVST